jgi:GNAT superfamily N-acetyltransferase
MFEVHLLADRPDLVGALARAYEREWPGWYGRAGNSAVVDLTARLRRDGLPLGLVAIGAGISVGACALVTTAGPIETDELPWLGALWVDPAHRRRGIATLLIERAVVEAARQGYATLHATTRDAAALFHALGWRLRETRQLTEGPLAVFDRTTESV